MVGSIKVWSYQMIEAGVGSIKYFFACLFSGRYSTQKHACICNNKAARFDPDLKIFVVSVSQFKNLLKKVFYAHQLFGGPIFHSHTTSNIDVLDIWESGGDLENVFCCFYENILIFFLQIRPDMLMETYDFDVIFLRNLQNFFKVMLADSEFVFRASSNDMVIFPCPHIWVVSDKNLFSCQFLAKVLKCLKGPHINYNSLLQSELNFRRTNKVLSVQDVLRKISTLKSSVNLSWRHNIHIHDSLPFVLDDFENFGVAIRLHGIRDVKILSCLLNFLHIAQYFLFFVDVKWRTVFLDEL